MEFRTYLRVFLGVLLLAMVVVDPLLYLVDEWDVKRLRSYRRERPEVVFLGDSVGDWVPVSDTDQRPLFTMLAADLGRPVFPFVHPAFSPVVYRKAAPLLVDWNSELRLVVMEVNLRTLSAYWKPDTTHFFERRQLLLQALAGEFELATYLGQRFGGSGPSVPGAGRDFLVYDDEIRLGSYRELMRELSAIEPIPDNGGYTGQERAMGRQFAFSYGTPLTADHPIFANIQEALDGLARADARVLVYLTPINREAVDLLGSPALRTRLDEKLALFDEIARERGWWFLDLSGVVADAHFVDRHHGSEHLDDEGRAEVAERLAREIFGRMPALRPAAGGPAGRSHADD